MRTYKPYLCRQFLPKKKMGLQSRKLFCEPVWHLWIESCTNRFCLQMIHSQMWGSCKSCPVKFCAYHLKFFRLVKVFKVSIRKLPPISTGLDDLEKYVSKPKKLHHKTTWNHDFATNLHLIGFGNPIPHRQQIHRKLQTLWGYFEKFSVFSTNHLLEKN